MTWNNSNISDQIYFICYIYSGEPDLKYRLTGSSKTDEGYVEVLFNNIWRLVKTLERTDRQSNKTAELLCNQIGFRTGSFKKGETATNRTAWFDVRYCHQKHMTIDSCRLGTLGESSDDARELYIMCQGINGTYIVHLEYKARKY